ncbi:MAG: flagellar basal body P-ring protein FlgI [Planctomycetota bacterium]
MKRRLFLLLCAASLLAGCSSWNLFSPNKPIVPSDTPEDQPHTVGDLAIPFGMFPVKIEAVGLVSGLHGAGSDPEPSPQRAMLMAEMQRRNVEKPNQLLATRNYSLVLVRGFLRPGIQKGDPFDVELRIKDRSETTSLRGGYLLETRLSDMAVIYGKLLDGKVRGIAQGPVLVDPSATEKRNSVQLGRGVVLGGGVARESRSVGLFLKNAEETNMTPEQLRNAAVRSAQVANAINRRFSMHKYGIKEGVARAIRGNYVDLAVDKTYKDNLVRYFQVLRAIELRESPAELSQRLANLKSHLLDPATAAEAAIKLEAIGKPAIDVLVAGAQSHDPKAQFFAAEALAYLDRREAAEPLAKAAHNAAFRSQALTALSVMRDTTAYDQLRELLGVPSAETRYGAFRALTVMCPDDSLVKGENFEQFSYHVLDTKGPVMIHVTRNRHAEVVLFGVNQRFLTPLVLNAGNQIMVTGNKEGEISVSKFVPHEADQKRTVSNRIDDVIRAIVELGGTYPDVVQALQEAKAAGCLEGRFEIDALPETGRSYEATAEGEKEGEKKKEEKEKEGKKSE